ncbi:MULTISPECIES: RagB/SusD family nutrient uptake outer membrane protein [Parabacteroides]|uniref:RagB/SusD family nutrient uptake outer membrane protein n=1 Tax=Parabacteroides leei TaxID=2939491 RepID=UPI00189AE1A8|nr:RagB/SusD family nutrient uptake outer membrane protein [Parabacteroides goldsteinii]
MKHNIITLLLGGCCLLNSCYELDINPLAQGSSENWYSSETEIEMALKDGYRIDFWPKDKEEWTDDYVYRETNSSIVNGTLNGQDGSVTDMWKKQYKAIARANTILANMEKAQSLNIPQNKIDLYTAEAYFLRASMYARLISHFGDVVYVTEVISIEEAFKVGRTPKAEIIPEVYNDFDKAAATLPVSYSGSTSQRATKGAALALKARFALYMGDWTVAMEAAKACIELDRYKLHPDFSDLFLSTTRNSEESIFVLPRSVSDKVTLGSEEVLNVISRNSGGWSAKDPSWDLLAAYTCTDGLPIDESPLFDSHDPFKNRDPRCTATIVAFGSRHLGFDYDPHPEALEVMNYNTGKMQKNNDTRANAQYASFNGLIWKKGVDETWLDNGKDVDPDYIIIRYADVLLMYAEAKIELNQIDQSVLDAINMVRARAYGVDKSATNLYPAVTVTDQSELRKIVRLERRMELAYEGLRYMDLVRWRLATKALSNKSYGLLYPASLLIENVTGKGGWFWPGTPGIDEDGIPDFSEMEKAGQIAVLSQRLWNDRQYLWPIPTKEILINENLRQNEGY